MEVFRSIKVQTIKVSKRRLWIPNTFNGVKGAKGQYIPAAARLFHLSQLATVSTKAAFQGNSRCEYTLEVVASGKHHTQLVLLCRPLFGLTP